MWSKSRTKQCQRWKLHCTTLDWTFRIEDDFMLRIFKLNNPVAFAKCQTFRAPFVWRQFVRGFVSTFLDSSYVQGFHLCRVTLFRGGTTISDEKLLQDKRLTRIHTDKRNDWKSLHLDNHMICAMYPCETFFSNVSNSSSLFTNLSQRSHQAVKNKSPSEQMPELCWQLDTFYLFWSFPQGNDLHWYNWNVRNFDHKVRREKHLASQTRVHTYARVRYQFLSFHTLRKMTFSFMLERNAFFRRKINLIVLCDILHPTNKKQQSDTGVHSSAKMSLLWVWNGS